MSMQHTSLLTEGVGHGAHGEHKRKGNPTCCLWVANDRHEMVCEALSKWSGLGWAGWSAQFCTETAAPRVCLSNRHATQTPDNTYFACHGRGRWCVEVVWPGGCRRLELVGSSSELVWRELLANLQLTLSKKVTTEPHNCRKTRSPLQLRSDTAFSEWFFLWRRPKWAQWSQCVAVQTNAREQHAELQKCMRVKSTEEVERCSRAVEILGHMISCQIANRGGPISCGVIFFAPQSSVVSSRQNSNDTPKFCRHTTSTRLL